MRKMRRPVASVDASARACAASAGVTGGASVSKLAQPASRRALEKSRRTPLAVRVISICDDGVAATLHGPRR